MCGRAKREKIRDSIDENLETYNTKKDLNNFVKLFKANRESIEGTPDRNVTVMLKAAIRMRKLRYKRTMTLQKVKQKHTK